MKKITHVLTLCGLMAVSASATDIKPEKPLPQSWESGTGITSELDNLCDWWKAFNDPTLDSLVTAGIDGNYDVRIAVDRIRAAKAMVGQAAAAYYPTLTASAGFVDSRSAGAIAGSNVPSSTTRYFSAGINMSWEIDLFGRITSQVRSKKALAEVSAADYRATMVSLAANIATAYINLRKYQSQLLVANEHLESQNRVLEIAETRHSAGLVSALDVAQAKTVYYSTEAEIPQLEASVRLSVNAIAVLLGVYPETIADNLLNSFNRPDYRKVVGAGVPMDMLRRRPDIIAAEKQIEAYAAQVGVARKDYLPSLTLQGTISTSAHKIDGMFGKNSLAYSIAPTLSWELFDGLSRNYALQGAKIQLEEAVSQYNQTVLTAVEEVDNAIVNYSASLRTIEITSEVMEQSHLSFTTAFDQYREGLAAFTDVAQAQISWLNTANSMVSARAQALLSLISLYQALGGAPAL